MPCRPAHERISPFSSLDETAAPRASPRAERTDRLGAALRVGCRLAVRAEGDFAPRWRGAAGAAASAGALTVAAPAPSPMAAWATTARRTPNRAPRAAMAASRSSVESMVRRKLFTSHWAAEVRPAGSEYALTAVRSNHAARVLETWGRPAVNNTRSAGSVTPQCLAEVGHARAS